METEQRGGGCGWAVVAVFPILALVVIGALNGTLPPLTGPSSPAPTSAPAVILAEQPAPTPMPLPTAAPVVIVPTARPVVIYPTTARPVGRDWAPTAAPASSSPSSAASLPPWAVLLLAGGGGILGGVLVVTLGLVIAPRLRRRMVASAPCPAAAPAPPVGPAPPGADPGARASGQEPPGADGRPIAVTEYLGHA